MTTSPFDTPMGEPAPPLGADDGWGGACDEGWGDPARLEQLGAEWAGELAGMSPQDRFEREHGIPANPLTLAAAAYGVTPASEDAAAVVQDELVQLEAVLLIADAHRIGALLRAFDASLADLGARFGAEYGVRAGSGSSAFFASIALRTHQDPRHVAHLVDTATLARDRLPATWAVFQGGAVAWRAIDTAVKQAEGLDPARWAEYDEIAARQVVVSNRLKDVLRKARERLQPDSADRRATTTFQRRAVFLDPGADGGSSWSITGSAADQTAWDAALTKAAIAGKVAGEERTVTQLRYDIARDLIVEGLQRSADPAAVGLAVPGRTGVPVRVVITVPALAWLGHSNEQARLAGYGPIAMETARRLAGDATSMLRVLTDPLTGVRVAMDRAVYRPPADLRRWVTVRDEWCRFPGCRRPADLCDLDHLTEWQHHGVTAADNLLSECRSHHSDKSVDLWRAELDEGGWAHWTDPWGNDFADPPVEPMDSAAPDLLPESPGPTRPPADDPPPF